MQQSAQKICPYCHGGNAPSASQCQWCGRYLQTGSGKVWGWLLIGIGLLVVALLFLTLMWQSLQGMAGTAPALTMRGYLVIGGGALILGALFILPGVLLLRRKSG